MEKSEKMLLKMAMLIRAKRFQKIPSVKELASVYKVSEERFKEEVEKIYGRSPSGILCQLTLLQAIHNVRNNGKTDHSELATDLGFTDGKSLYQFLCQHLELGTDLFIEKAFREPKKIISKIVGMFKT